jgi:hypothetical protein
MVLLTLALMTAGIGGAVAAHAAPTPASLAWSPTTSSGTFDYGTLAADTAKSVTFTLTNAGGKATGSLRITLSGSAAFTITQKSCTGRSLGPNKSCTVPVAYAPKSSGQSESATLTASGKSASSSLTLTGTTGVGGTPNLTLSPGFSSGSYEGTNIYLYVFGQVASATQTFTVTNSGTGSSDPLGMQCCFANGLSLSNDMCSGQTLAPNGVCTFEMSWMAPFGCTSGEIVNGGANVIGTDLTYINFNVSVNCP